MQGFTLKLSTDNVIGNGSFGVVFEAKIQETGETVAIKKVLQDKRFKVSVLARTQKLMPRCAITIVRMHLHMLVCMSCGLRRCDPVYLQVTRCTRGSLKDFCERSSPSCPPFLRGGG